MSTRKRWADPQRFEAEPPPRFAPVLIREFIGTASTDKAAERCERSAVRPVRRRRLLVGGKEYAAFDAHDLLDATAADLGRPGHPYG